MDRAYIESQEVVERYLSGDLLVREARAFEKYCLEHPEFLAQLPIPVRLKTRLARRPFEDSETGIFPAIPSGTTREAVEMVDTRMTTSRPPPPTWRRAAGSSWPCCSSPCWWPARVSPIT